MKYLTGLDTDGGGFEVSNLRLKEKFNLKFKYIRYDWYDPLIFVFRSTGSEEIILRFSDRWYMSFGKYRAWLTSINAYKGGTNTYEIVVSDNTVKLYINDQFITQ